MKRTIDTDKHLKTIKKAYTAVDFEIGSTQNLLVETHKQPQHHDKEQVLIHELKKLVALKKFLGQLVQFSGKVPVSEENYQLMVDHQDTLSDVKKLVSIWQPAKQALSAITEEDLIAEAIEEESEADEVLDAPKLTEAQMMQRLVSLFQQKMVVAAESDAADSKKYMKRAVMNHLFMNARAQIQGAAQTDLAPNTDNGSLGNQHSVGVSLSS